MLWLFTVAGYLLTEAMCWRKWRERRERWRRGSRDISGRKKEWIERRTSSVPFSSHHLQLAAEGDKYVGERKVLAPYYKPIPYYYSLRGVHFLCCSLMRCSGWSCRVHDGIWFWEKKGSKKLPILLFLHGFGFGPFIYYTVLQQLSSQGYTIVAPQYPGLAYDGREEDIPASPSLFAATIVSYMQQKKYVVVSNSFGCVVHSALLRELGSKAVDTILYQIYVEPVCFFPYAGKLFRFIELSLSTCLMSPNYKAAAVALVSWALVSKDISTLYICQQVLEDGYWDGEHFLSFIPSTLILSSEDSIIESTLLQKYIVGKYSKVQVVMIRGSYHGEAMFSKGGELNEILASINADSRTTAILPASCKSLHHRMGRSQSLSHK